MVTGTQDDLHLLDGTRFWANPLITEWRWVDGGRVLTAQGRTKKSGSHSQDKHR